MSNQYFENNPNLTSNIKIIDHYYYNHLLKIKTDSGIFSKNAIDQGTLILLKNIYVDKNVKKILDVGCGCGVIGLSLAADNPTCNVDMIDINLRAIELVNDNIQLNNIKNANVFESNCYEKINSKYDLIVSNPPIRAGKEIVHKIAIDGYDHLNDDGKILLVINKKHGLESLKKTVMDKYGNCKVLTKDLGFSVIEANKNTN